MKKLTKLTALALAFALVLGMTAMAADTKVYHVEDFTKYAAYSDFAAQYTVFDKDAIATSYLPTAATLATLKEANATATGAIYARGFSNGQGTSVITNGKIYPLNAFNAGWSSWNMTMIVPKNQWNTLVGAGETYVVSYDFEGTIRTEVAPAATFSWWSNGTSLLMTNDDITASTPAYGTMPYYSAAEPGVFDLAGRGDKMEPVINETSKVNSGETYRVGFGINSNEAGHLKKTFAINGVINAKDNRRQNNTGYNNVFGFVFAAPEGINVGYGNIRMYTVKTNAFAAAVDGAVENIALSTDKVRIKFNNPVAHATFNANDVVVKAGDEVVTNYTVGKVVDVIGGIGEEAYSYVDIDFTSDLMGGKTYSVEFAETLVNEIGTALNNTAVTFETEPAPVFTISLKAYKGLAATGSELNALGAGTTYFSIGATYSSGAVVANGTVVLDILDSEGNVVKTVSSEKSLSGTASFGAALKLEDGQSAKAYVEGTSGVATIAAK